MQIGLKNFAFFRNLKILQLDDLIKLETAKFMNSCDKNALPPHFGNYFRKINQVHNRSTRLSDKKLSYLPRYWSNRLQRSIKFRGVKVWNDIPFELKSYYKIGNHYKHHLLESYYIVLHQNVYAIYLYIYVFFFSFMLKPTVV